MCPGGPDFGADTWYACTHANELMNGPLIRYPLKDWRPLCVDIVDNPHYVSPISLRVFNETGKVRTLNVTNLGWDQLQQDQDLLDSIVNQSGPRPKRMSKDLRYTCMEIEWWARWYLRNANKTRWSQSLNVKDITYSKLKKKIDEKWPFANPIVNGTRALNMELIWTKFRLEFMELNPHLAHADCRPPTLEYLKKHGIKIEFRSQGCWRMSASGLFFLDSLIEGCPQRDLLMWNLCGAYKLCV